jgi:alkyl sulfatase BDS1-like metallo-beta-lactamase superfamily hydrolase
LAEDPDLTLTINRSDLELTMMGAKTLEAQIADGSATVDGDASVLQQLASTMVDFDPRFEIMPGTKVRDTELETSDPYEADLGVPAIE